MAHPKKIISVFLPLILVTVAVLGFENYHLAFENESLICANQSLQEANTVIENDTKQLLLECKRLQFQYEIQKRGKDFRNKFRNQGPDKLIDDLIKDANDRIKQPKHEIENNK